MDHLTCPTPSLQPHYKTFTATTSRPAPVPRVGTLPLTVFPACGSPCRQPVGHNHPHRSAVSIETTGSPVPCQRLQTSSLNLYAGHHQGHTQAAPWSREHLNRHSFVPGHAGLPVLMSSQSLSTRQQWFTHVRLLVAYLTRCQRAFSAVASHPGSLPT